MMIVRVPAGDNIAIIQSDQPTFVNDHRRRRRSRDRVRIASGPLPNCLAACRRVAPGMPAAGDNAVNERWIPREMLGIDEKFRG
jgi:hypothetical protein